MAAEMRLDWLRTFVAVVETGSFTGAAGRVYRTQSRVSAHIAALEEDLGTQLVIRNTSPLLLTAAGEVFLQSTRDVLREVERAHAAVAGLRGEVAGSLRLASYPGASALVIAPIIRQFSDQYPRLQIELLDGLPDELAAMVLHGRADIALRQEFRTISASSLRTVPLFREPIMAILPGDHPWVALDSIDGSMLTGERVVLTGDKDARSGHFSYILRNAGVRPSKEILVSQPTTVAAFANAGLGIGLIPGLAAQISVFGSLVTRPVVGDPIWNRGVVAVTNATQQRTRAMEAFFDALAATPLAHGLLPPAAALD